MPNFWRKLRKNIRIMVCPTKLFTGHKLASRTAVIELGELQLTGCRQRSVLSGHCARSNGRKFEFSADHPNDNCSPGAISVRQLVSTNQSNGHSVSPAIAVPRGQQQDSIGRLPAAWRDKQNNMFTTQSVPAATWSADSAGKRPTGKHTAGRPHSSTSSRSRDTSPPIRDQQTCCSHASPGRSSCQSQQQLSFEC